MHGHRKQYTQLEDDCVLAVLVHWCLWLVTQHDTCLPLGQCIDTGLITLHMCQSRIVKMKSYLHRMLRSFGEYCCRSGISQLTASSSALWSLVRPPLIHISGHESMVSPTVYHWPQSQSWDAARPHLYKLAWHGPWSVWKQFSSVHDWRGRSKPSCWMKRSHTRCWLITEADNQSSSHYVVMSMGAATAASAQIGWRDVSRCSVWFMISARSGHSRWFSIVLRKLSLTTSWWRRGERCLPTQATKESEWVAHTLRSVTWCC